MLSELTYSRPDGTFVGVVNGLPYHILENDEIYADALAWVAAHGQPPLEPAMPQEPAPALPTLSELQAQLAALQAQIEALATTTT